MRTLIHKTIALLLVVQLIPGALGAGLELTPNGFNGFIGPGDGRLGRAFGYYFKALITADPEAIVIGMHGPWSQGQLNYVTRALTNVDSPVMLGSGPIIVHSCETGCSSAALSATRLDPRFGAQELGEKLYGMGYRNPIIAPIGGQSGMQSAFGGIGPRYTNFFDPVTGASLGNDVPLNQQYVKITPGPNGGISVSNTLDEGTLKSLFPPRPTKSVYAGSLLGGIQGWLDSGGPGRFLGGLTGALKNLGGALASVVKNPATWGNLLGGMLASFLGSMGAQLMGATQGVGELGGALLGMGVAGLMGIGTAVGALPSAIIGGIGTIIFNGALLGYHVTNGMYNGGIGGYIGELGGDNSYCENFKRYYGVDSCLPFVPPGNGGGGAIGGMFSPLTPPMSPDCYSTLLGGGS